jgi:hypothetical protein
MEAMDVNADVVMATTPVDCPEEMQLTESKAVEADENRLEEQQQQQQLDGDDLSEKVAPKELKDGREVEANPSAGENGATGRRKKRRKKRNKTPATITTTTLEPLDRTESLLPPPASQPLARVRQKVHISLSLGPPPKSAISPSLTLSLILSLSRIENSIRQKHTSART